MEQGRGRAAAGRSRAPRFPTVGSGAGGAASGLLPFRPRSGFVSKSWQSHFWIELARVLVCGADVGLDFGGCEAVYFKASIKGD